MAWIMRCFSLFLLAVLLCGVGCRGGEVQGAQTEVQAEPEGAEMDAARRYAKLLATDIRLYNEEAVMLGRQHGDLVERLMGKKPELRFQYIQENARFVEELDV